MLPPSATTVGPRMPPPGSWGFGVIAGAGSAARVGLEEAHPVASLQEAHRARWLLLPQAIALDPQCLDWLRCAWRCARYPATEFHHLDTEHRGGSRIECRAPPTPQRAHPPPAFAVRRAVHPLSSCVPSRCRHVRLRCSERPANSRRRRRPRCPRAVRRRPSRRRAGWAWCGPGPSAPAHRQARYAWQKRTAGTVTGPARPMAQQEGMQKRTNQFAVRQAGAPSLRRRRGHGCGWLVRGARARPMRMAPGLIPRWAVRARTVGRGGANRG